MPVRPEIPAAASALDMAGLDGLVGFQLRRAFLWSNQLFAKAMAGPGLVPGQLGALKIIAVNPGCTPSALAVTVGLDPSSLTPILAQLEAKGLIERRVGADRRRTSLHPTGAGMLLVSEAEPDVLRHETAITAALTASEREQLLRLLGKMQLAQSGS